MGNAISKVMDYIGKKLTDTRKGRTDKKRWKNKRDLYNYKMVRGEDLYEDEIDRDGVPIVQL